MTEMTIDPAVAEELFDAVPGTRVGNWEKVADQEGNEGRWERHHLLVLLYNGPNVDDVVHSGLFGIEYSRGLTENQEHSYPWYREPGSFKLTDRPVTCIPLEQREVVAVHYERRKKAT